MIIMKNSGFPHIKLQFGIINKQLGYKNHMGYTLCNAFKLLNYPA